MAWKESDCRRKRKGGGREGQRRNSDRLRSMFACPLKYLSCYVLIKHIFRDKKQVSPNLPRSSPPIMQRSNATPTYSQRLLPNYAASKGYKRRGIPVLLLSVIKSDWNCEDNFFCAKFGCFSACPFKNQQIYFVRISPSIYNCNIEPTHSCNKRESVPITVSKIIYLLLVQHLQRRSAKRLQN